ncbi:MAG: hypothetical protein M3Z56_06525 [Bacteroidota bacterium]|nr:hypothetical protein [Bacteroidota bacterium]MDQ6903376.1 hypothetical protein [Bacteroidota bacterium]
MAINKNHEFEELDGVKCGIVERNVTPGRIAFLKDLLEYNGYGVKVVPTPLPKQAQAPPPKEGEAQAPTPPPLPETFTIGVTDYTFNTINAIFGRTLKTKNGHIVTLAYWQQKESTSHDEVPYFDAEK